MPSSSSTRRSTSCATGNFDPTGAVVESVRSRVRPILMSTLTSVGGMLPLVLMPGAGSELYRGLGAVVVGGLTVSTIFTVLLVPAVLSVIFALRNPEVDSEPESSAGAPAKPATA